ncbi:uncharacterized protein LOC128204844 [Mya arenaria]|nr:uncharacterized protein LOC128204844 [Mya arenaria]
MASNNTTEQSAFMLRDGYDIPVYGLANGKFYYVHIPAIVCIAVSLSCALAAITLSFRRKSYRTFFSKWSKSERLVVYLSTFDALFSVSHLPDHLQIVITKDHVRPRELCTIYGFMLVVFFAAQMLIVNVVAIDAFVMMYFNKKIYFGKYDSGLLVLTFGVPFVGAVVAAVYGQFGPMGSACFYDAVKGNVANLSFTTIPLPIVMTVNITLYILTWFKIRNQVNNLKNTLGPLTRTTNAPCKAARNMSMFVLTAFVQWWSVAVFGVWALVVNNPAQIPEILHDIGVIFTNLGGIMNLIIYLKLKRTDLQRQTNELRAASSNTTVKTLSTGSIQSKDSLSDVPRT